MNKENTFKSKTELILALEQLEREKNIKRDDVFKTITDALVSALRKYFGKTSQIAATIDPDTGEMCGYLVKKVVKEVFTPEIEISEEEAVKYEPSAKLDEEVNIPVDIQDFSRIAAQTAKQVLIQKIREIEKVKLFDEFKPREGEIVTGLVHHIAGRDIFVDLGKTEAVLPYSEQIRREHYTINQRVRAIIHRVDKENKGLQIVLSRASIAFLKGLFEAEVPEIAEKVVEISDVVRDPGFRSKVVVKSNSSKVDPVGACVGIRGSRIRVIMAELSNEKIDLIPYTEEPLHMLAKSFSPATVLSVRVIDKASKKALIIVPDDQLAIAIGREGQNIKLVSRLTGWELEVKSEGQKVEEAKKTNDMAVQDLLKVDGIGAKVADTLVKLGMSDIRKIAGFTVEDLCALEGIGEKTAQKIVSGANKFLEENPGYGNKTAPSAAPKVLENKEVQENESKETESK
ncbi:MAG: transcription termination factor NusA [Elusimicrobia bacterium GWA2_56_46]|nr:MAG: transcription termination factor NusA [Elusimicrobia bacterium GWA2_56_46]OGR55639.1 MAG: transcription termination factor NusA [Elusimicrobia bacterium GWC2_56_31]HBW22756.1 transcription termination/antitermination protein NusA [Elusimicrobiota bacterium]